MTFYSRKILRLSSMVVAALALQACDSSDDPSIQTQSPPTPPNTVFEVTATNLTNAQPLSPIAVIAHAGTYSVFTIGSPATVGLESLAEGGDNSMLIAEARANTGVANTTSGAAPIGPGGSGTVTFAFPEDSLPGLRMSVSTMLVNTNDAITGVNGVSIAGMAVGETITVYGIAYDAGTEANSEQAIHIPGPAGGGEGFNAVRDDRADQVKTHSGVVGQDDGFATSSLNNQHRFDNPIVRISISRTS